ncbi:MAG: dsbC [Ramlibacter sp.]|jgi:thiol:disulfide interchange protein DsbC|nr:dsbC [Ramlibacter sp.]
MKAIRYGLAAALMVLGLTAGAQQKNQAPAATNAVTPVTPAIDAQVRRNLEQRLPNIGKIDEISRTPLPGLYEIRVGSDLFYSDAEGNYLVVNGHMIDTRGKRNLTEERLEKLLAVDFDQLPLKDAFVIVRGNGKRKLAVFEDPNCGYCKRFEASLQKVDNVTVYMFLYPILGPDSTEKSKGHWCAKDKVKTWNDWMLRNEPPAKADPGCDTSALARNIEFGKKHKITGTPTLIFADGTRVPGAIGTPEIEKLLVAASK